VHLVLQVLAPAAGVADAPVTLPNVAKVLATIWR
jgi:hypothetical protein